MREPARAPQAVHRIEVAEEAVEEQERRAAQPDGRQDHGQRDLRRGNHRAFGGGVRPRPPRGLQGREVDRRAGVLHKPEGGAPSRLDGARGGDGVEGAHRRRHRKGNQQPHEHEPPQQAEGPAGQPPFEERTQQQHRRAEHRRRQRHIHQAQKQVFHSFLPPLRIFSGAAPAPLHHGEAPADKAALKLLLPNGRGASSPR